MAQERGDGALPQDPVVEEYKKHLDVTLLVESLKRTPQERIEAIQQMNALVADMRKGMPVLPSRP
jgi:hypothetical protein